MLKLSLSLQAVGWWHVCLTDDVPLHDESPPPIVPCLWPEHKKSIRLPAKRDTSKNLGQELKFPPKPKYPGLAFILVNCEKLRMVLP